MHELSNFLDRPNVPVADEVERELAAGPIDPAAALRADELAQLLTPGYLHAETGYCRNPDGSAFVAVLTPMPKVTAEMIDWWFDWHPRDPMRYRIWFPDQHFDISFQQAARPGEKPFYNSIHHPVEDVGLGRSRIRIEFVEPVEFGFPANSFEPRVSSTIVCGYAGDDRLKVRHTRMCHFVRDVDVGVELRSRFWIGSLISSYASSPLVRPFNRLMNTKVLRSRAIPKRAPETLARHCAQEYANLAELLPELWSRYGNGTDRG